jgi:hypothetical protein
MSQESKGAKETLVQVYVSPPAGTQESWVDTQ